MGFNFDPYNTSATKDKVATNDDVASKRGGCRGSWKFIKAFVTARTSSDRAAQAAQKLFHLLREKLCHICGNDKTPAARASSAREVTKSR